MNNEAQIKKAVKAYIDLDEDNVFTEQEIQEKMSVEKEIEQLLEEKDALYRKIQEGYEKGANTRSRLTTLNARITDKNEQIQELRKILKGRSTQRSRAQASL